MDIIRKKVLWDVDDKIDDKILNAIWIERNDYHDFSDQSNMVEYWNPIVRVIDIKLGTYKFNF